MWIGHGFNSRPLAQFSDVAAQFRGWLIASTANDWLGGLSGLSRPVGEDLEHVRYNVPSQLNFSGKLNSGVPGSLANGPALCYVQERTNASWTQRQPSRLKPDLQPE